MMRIRGRIGDWPVDLTLELEREDWSQLAQALQSVPQSGDVATAAAPAVASDGLWQTALQLVRDAGQIEGPRLLTQLAALAGGDAAGKRLLVRLRHCEQIRMETGEDAPIYHWQGQP